MAKLTEDDVKKFVKERVMVIEASSITGTGAGQGARTTFDDMEVAMRLGNPYRMFTQAKPLGSNTAYAQFNRLTGDEFTGSAWLANSTQADAGTVGSIAWTQTMQLLASYFDVRNAVFQDITSLTETLNYDIMRLVGTLEGTAMSQNSDIVTPASLRGFPSYATGTPAYASNGYHTLASTPFSLAATDDNKYDAIVNMVGSLNGAYWNMPDLAFMCHPAMLTALRKLKSSSGSRLLVETPAEMEMNGLGVRAFLFGIPVIINNTLTVVNQSTLTAGDVPFILGSWNNALEIIDGGCVVTWSTQTKPGTTRVYVEHKVATTVANPFALVQLNITA